MNQLAAVALAITLATGAPVAPPSPPPDAAAILQRSQGRWQGLNSYQVPVTVSGSVRVSIISLPFRMTGTQYYRAPDQQALHLDNPPRLARGFGNTLSAMGTPQTWLRDYTIAMPVSQPHGHHAAYLLTGTPKVASRVKSMTMWVSATTYAVESILFSYTNGATLQVRFVHHQGFSQYHLPRSATVIARFPGYSGNATITYGNYQLNQPLAASLFNQH
jgi:outer membrane lipoprotein-sorting protein